jgi:hypothetical protein
MGSAGAAAYHGTKGAVRILSKVGAVHYASSETLAAPTRKASVSKWIMNSSTQTLANAYSYAYPSHPRVLQSADCRTRQLRNSSRPGRCRHCKSSYAQAEIELPAAQPSPRRLWMHPRWRSTPKDMAGSPRVEIFPRSWVIRPTDRARENAPQRCIVISRFRKLNIKGCSSHNAGNGLKGVCYGAVLAVPDVVSDQPRF